MLTPLSFHAHTGKLAVRLDWNPASLGIFRTQDKCFHLRPSFRQISALELFGKRAPQPHGSVPLRTRQNAADVYRKRQMKSFATWRSDNRHLACDGLKCFKYGRSGKQAQIHTFYMLEPSMEELYYHSAKVAFRFSHQLSG